MQSRTSRRKNKKTNCRPLPQRNMYNITTVRNIYQRITEPKYISCKYLLQTDDVDIEFSKVFTEYIKSIQHQNSQKASSIFTNEVFRIVYSYLSFLQKPESQGTSPVQTSKHTTVRHKITIIFENLNTIRENLTSNDVSQNNKHNLQKKT